jgi:hypothetical protein
MKRNVTEEQKRAAAERRERFKGICRQIAGMPETERAGLVDQAGAVVTCEGRALSPRNTMLLFLQRPGVSVVGGFRQWLKVGRVVKRGEKSACIWIPSGRGPGAESGGAEGEVSVAALAEAGEGKARFLTGHVFDISQTEEMPADVAASDWEGGGEA